MTRLIFCLFVGSIGFLNGQSDTIPFKLTIHNNIIIEAMLNDSDALDLMFHTGAGDVSLTEEAVARIKAQREQKTTKVLSWGGYSQTKFSENNTLKIGNFTWDSLNVWTSERSGHLSDGKFGPNMFEGKIIELNFDRSIMVIHPMVPQSIEDYSKFDLTFSDGSMFLAGLCDNGEEA